MARSGCWATLIAAGGSSAGSITAVTNSRTRPLDETVGAMSDTRTVEALFMGGPLNDQIHAAPGLPDRYRVPSQSETSPGEHEYQIVKFVQSLDDFQYGRPGPVYEYRGLRPSSAAVPQQRQ